MLFMRNIAIYLMKQKEVELIVFGAKDRRESWSQFWAAGWVMEIFTETQKIEGEAG